MQISRHLTDVDYRQIGKNIQQLKNIKNADAKRFISFIASRYKVIMLNEANNKPLHRAFAYSLLDVLYNRGFRYLAMEMLNPMPDHELTKLTYKTGTFCNRTCCRRIDTSGIELGFTLVAYEDPQGNSHTPTERDSIQALNIAKYPETGSGSKNFCICIAMDISRKKVPPRILFQWVWHLKE